MVLKSTNVIQSLLLHFNFWREFTISSLFSATQTIQKHIEAQCLRQLKKTKVIFMVFIYCVAKVKIQNFKIVITLVSRLIQTDA